MYAYTNGEQFAIVQRYAANCPLPTDTNKWHLSYTYDHEPSLLNSIETSIELMIICQTKLTGPRISTICSDIRENCSRYPAYYNY